MLVKKLAAVLALLIFIIPLYAQINEKMFHERCKITIDPLNTQKPRLNTLPGEVVLEKNICILKLDQPVIIRNKGTEIKILSDDIEIKMIHNMKLTHKGESVEFNTGNTVSCNTKCRIDSPNADKIMKKILELQKRWK